MANEEHITVALERLAGVFNKRPATAFDTTKSRAILEKGFQVNITEGDNTAVMDMGEVMGGNGAGPSPGFFGRAGLIGCVAMGIKIAAATARVPLDKVTVDVEMDWDSRGMFGTVNAPPDPVSTRLIISVQSPASKAIVQQIIEEGLRNDTWLQIALKPQKIEQIIHINQESL